MPPRETVLITGPTAGIGLELARLFAADGSDLILVARRADRMEALAKELQAGHRTDVRVIAKDLARPDAPAELFESLKNRGASVDVLVNNAGFGARGFFADLDIQRQLDVLQVNINAVTALTRLFLPPMLARRKGGILNVASTAAFQPGPMMSVYYAAKAYVLHFSEALYEEIRGSGVTVTCLCPGPTETEFQAVAGMTPSFAYRSTAMSAARAAKKGHRSFRRGKLIAIPGFVNHLGAVLSQLGPRWAVRKVTRRLNT